MATIVLDSGVQGTESPSYGAKGLARVARSGRGAKASSTPQTSARIFSTMKLLLLNLKIHGGPNSILSLSVKGTKTAQQKVTEDSHEILG